MQFQHAPQLWAAFPQLVPAAAVVNGITASPDVSSPVQQFTRRAAERLVDRSEAELPEIQAWRRAFSQMGLKPTQYRCASEALLRRFRKEGQLPSVHPLVDLCNALSIAYATPIGVFDLDHVDSHLEVRHAGGTESYRTFGATPSISSRARSSPAMQGNKLMRVAGPTDRVACPQLRPPPPGR